MTNPQSAIRNPQFPRRGVTLLDLVITVMILGIAAAVALPRYSAAAERYRVQAAAQQIVNDLDYARRNASAVSQNRTVTFSTVDNNYELNGVSSLDHTGQPFKIFLSQTGYPATLTTANFDGNSEVTFDIHGRPYSGSTTATPLTSGLIVVQSGGFQKTILIDPATGKASMQ